MEVTRRDLLKVAGIAATVGLTGRALAEADDAPERLLEFESLGNVTRRSVVSLPDDNYLVRRDDLPRQRA